MYGQPNVEITKIITGIRTPFPSGNPALVNTLSRTGVIANANKIDGKARMISIKREST
ncbi:unannotated protein [freshwater metagenome]|uniref:Unannotated protein n=1 Tax=freshwater metagenome TaxID=449393 RepID=A0A6J6X221_9ZZZZ